MLVKTCLCWRGDSEVNRAEHWVLTTTYNSISTVSNTLLKQMNKIVINVWRLDSKSSEPTISGGVTLCFPFLLKHGKCSPDSELVSLKTPPTRVPCWTTEETHLVSLLFLWNPKPGACSSSEPRLSLYCIFFLIIEINSIPFWNLLIRFYIFDIKVLKQFYIQIHYLHFCFIFKLLDLHILRAL